MLSLKLITTGVVLILMSLQAMACDEKLTGKWSCSLEEKSLVLELDWNAKTKVLTETKEDGDSEAIIMDGESRYSDGYEVTGLCLKSGKARVSRTTSSFINLTLVTEFKMVSDDELNFILKDEQDVVLPCKRILPADL